MATVVQRRKVLVLSGGPYVRNLLALVHELDGQSCLDCQAVLAVINRQEFDAIVLELRWPDVKAAQEIQGLKEIRPSWDGNLLVITAELNGPRTLEMLEQYLVDGRPQAVPMLISHPCPSAA